MARLPTSDGEGVVVRVRQKTTERTPNGSHKGSETGALIAIKDAAVNRVRF